MKRPPVAFVALLLAALLNVSPGVGRSRATASDAHVSLKAVEARVLPGPAADEATKSRTPGNTRAYVFAPFGFDANIAGAEQPAIDALRAEHYDLHVLRRTTLDDAALLAHVEDVGTATDPGMPSVNTFVHALKDRPGVLVMVEHGKQESQGTITEGALALEAYSSEGARDERLKTLKKNKDFAAAPDRLIPRTEEASLPGETKPRLVYLIAMETTLIGTLLREAHGMDHSLVYITACESAKVADTFAGHGAEFSFGYHNKCPVNDGKKDLREFWTRLDGTKYHGADPGRVERNTRTAVSECCGESGGGPYSPNKGAPLVLAPAVTSHVPAGGDRGRSSQAEVRTGKAVKATVNFDAPVDGTVQATEVVDLDGCGYSHGTPPTANWNDAHNKKAPRHLDFTFKPTEGGELTVTIRAVSNGQPGIRAAASPEGNGISLDGNTGPPNQPGDGPVAPNEDSYVWKVTCKAPPAPAGGTGECKKVFLGKSHQAAPCTPTPNPEDLFVTPPTATDTPTDTPTVTDTPTLTPKPTRTPRPTITTTPVTPRPAGPRLALSPAALDFGTVVLGGQAATRDVVATNVGDAPLHLSSVSITGDTGDVFAAGQTGCTTTLDPGQSCPFTVGFLPHVTGDFTASVTFMDDASDSPQQLLLHGAAVAEHASATLEVESQQVQPNALVQVCYAVSEPSYVRLVETFPDGSSEVEYQGLERGQGRCAQVAVGPEPGLRVLRLEMYTGGSLIGPEYVGGSLVATAQVTLTVQQQEQPPGGFHSARR